DRPDRDCDRDEMQDKHGNDREYDLGVHRRTRRNPCRGQYATHAEVCAAHLRAERHPQRRETEPASHVGPRLAAKKRYRSMREGRFHWERDGHWSPPTRRKGASAELTLDSTFAAAPTLSGAS